MSAAPGRECSVSSESQTGYCDKHLVQAGSLLRNCSSELPRDGIPERPDRACEGPLVANLPGLVLSMAKQSEETLQEPGLLSRAFLKHSARKVLAHQWHCCGIEMNPTDLRQFSSTSF